MSRTGMKMLLVNDRKQEERTGNRRGGDRRMEMNRYEDLRNEDMRYEEPRQGYARYEEPRQGYSRYEERRSASPRYEDTRSARYDDDREETESRFRDRRGREHYDNGRYAPKRSMAYSYEREEEEPKMEYPRPYLVPKSTVGFKGNRDMQKRGHAGSSEMEFDRQTADEWVKEMQNMDGSKGPHWNREQVQQFMRQTGFQGNPEEFYAIMNAMYSDYCAVAKKFGFDRPEVYAHLAKAFLDDEDAVEDKAAIYFHYIVE